ncbi:MAG: CRISPR-associated endonuclease Cas1, partial [Candidatus Cloacimonetes bacterium]|nr:CRISPR-associated endonuclease Cas1 [Candidatus Cloacimonadota bacterium]
IKTLSDNDHCIRKETIELESCEASRYQPDHNFVFPPDSYSDITLIFSSPLRLKRSDKSDGRYFDPFHFDFNEFIGSLSNSLNVPVPDISGVSIKDKSFIWIDLKYQKTIGGIIGGLVLSGNFSQELLHLLHAGQFYGLGKNRHFGFGFYYLAEHPHPFFRMETRRGTEFSFNGLREILLEMVKHNETGSDLTAQDLLEHPDFIQRLSNKLRKGEYQPQEPKFFKIKKKNGGFRAIASYTMIDKLVLKALTDVLDRDLQSLLTSECYSYRKGYSFHLAAEALKKEFEKGFSWGVKLDIDSFFDTVSISKLNLVLLSLFGQSVKCSLIASFFRTTLIQGNSTSPLLSNLALIAFDSWFRRHKNLKLIRYADDMVILGRNADKSAIMLEVENMLKELGLSINKYKSLEFSQTSTVEFLGYSVSESDLSFRRKEEDNDDDDKLDWLPYQKMITAKSRPLFLSFSINYAHTTGNNLHIESGESRSVIPWKEISRILVFGKPRLSGGIIYRAMFEQVPLYFLTIHGKPVGGFLTNRPVDAVEKLFNSYDGYSFADFSLDFIREIAFTKIINQYRLLKRHEITDARISALADDVFKADNEDTIRGKEGYAAKLYFEHFRKLVEPFPFESRSYHPPEGPVNVMLSLGYSLIYRRFAESLRFHGIDSFQGIFHQGRGTHEALASDLLECYRFLIDRIVLSLIHKKQIQLENFNSIPNSSYLKMDSSGFRIFIRYFEKTMKSEVKIKNRFLSYEEWIDSTVLSLKNSLFLSSQFRAYRNV